MSSIERYQSSPFDAIRQIDENGQEFWSARDLQNLLGYVDWRKFEDAIERAMISCEISGTDPSKHWVVRADKPIISGKGRVQNIKDYHMTRYACYQTAQNGDVRKKEIADAQRYFLVKAREAELLLPQRHHINQNYYQRLKVNRDRFEKSRFTILEVLDNLSLKWGYDLFELTERCRPDISYGQVFMNCLRDAGYNTTIGKPDSEITKVWHVVDLETMLEKEVNSFPNKWYSFNLECFGTIYVADYLPKYLRGRTPDGVPRIANPEAAIADLQEKLAYTYQRRLF